MASARMLYAVISVLTAAMLLSATAAAYYQFEYDRSQRNASTYLTELKEVQPTQTTNFLLDFGNGTLVWHNNTQVQTGTNAYVATVIVARGVVDATWDAELGEHLIDAIDNVQNTQQQFWFIWTYNATARWQVAEVGADLLPVYNGSVFAWTFCNYNSTTYVPMCTP